MVAKTQRNTSSQPLVCSMPPEAEASSSTGRSTPIARPTPNTIEGATAANTLAEKWDLRPGRSAIQTMIADLPPGTAAETFFKAEVKVEAAGKVEAKARIENRADGKIEVTVEGLGALGAGLDGGHVFGGVSEGVKLVFDRPEQAADFLHAAATGFSLLAAQSQHPLITSAADAALGLWRDTATRLARASSNVEVIQAGSLLEVEGDVGKTKEGSSMGGSARAKAGATVSSQAEVDFAQGRVTRRTRLETKFEGELGLSLGGAPLASAVSNRFNGKGELKPSVAIEERRKLPAETLEQLRRGTLSPIDFGRALASAPVEYVAVIKVEGELRGNGGITGMGRAELSTEVVLSRALANELLAGKKTPLDVVANATWEGKIEGAIGLNQAIDLGVVDVEGGATRWWTKKGELGSFSQVLERCVKHFDEQQQLSAQLARQRQPMLG
jgi:hypothetical protein